MTEGERKGRGGEDAGPHITSVWEWVVGVVGGLLVLGTIAAMGYEALTREGAPPDFVVTVIGVQRVTGGHLVEFRAENRGGTAAAGVQVEGELSGGGEEEPETSDITIDYVPSGSSREAGLLFTRDPRSGNLQIRVKGYDLP
jgi:uncharacterized protein (TIGR02588 family)